MSDITKCTTFNLIAIFALYCCMSEFTILTPSIATFAQHFADTDLTTIMFANSITGIVSVPVSIAAGAVLHKIGFRPMAIIGILVMTLGGAAPFLMPDLTNYNVVIVSRIIVGVGLGMLFPVGGALIIAYYTGLRRSRYLGWGIMLQFVFAIIYTIAAGFLTEIAWNYSFLAYLIALIPLAVVIVWLPEAKGIVAQKTQEEKAAQKTIKERIPKAVYGYALFGLLVWTATVTVQVIGSSILAERNIADAGLAGIIISACGVGIIVSGILFPHMVKCFKGKVFALSAVVVAIGMIPCFFADSAAMYALGLFIIGFGGATFFTASQNSTGNLSPQTRIPFINGLMISMMNLGPFFAPYWATVSALLFLQVGLSAAFLTSLGAMVIVAIVALIVPLKAITRKHEGKSEGVSG